MWAKYYYFFYFPDIKIKHIPKHRFWHLHLRERTLRLLSCSSVWTLEKDAEFCCSISVYCFVVVCWGLSFLFFCWLFVCLFFPTGLHGMNPELVCISRCFTQRALDHFGASSCKLGFAVPNHLEIHKSCIR